MASRQLTDADLAAYSEPKAAPVVTVGTSGLRHSGGHVSEELHPRLSGTQAIRVYREMRDNSAIIGGGMRAAEELVAATSWSVEASSTQPIAMMACDLVRTALEDMDQTWQDFISEVMTMGTYGWAYMEEVYKYRRGDSELREFRSRYSDGLVGWRKIALRGQDTLYRWELGVDDDTLGMWQTPLGYGSRLVGRNWLRFVSAKRALHFRTKSIKNNPEGRSWLRNAYRSWWFCKRIEEVEAIGVERNIAGYPDYQVPAEWFKPNASAADKAALELVKKLVENVRADAHAGVVRPSERDQNDKPTGHVFKLISAGGRDPGAFDTIVKRYESRILISMLCEFLVLGMDKVGSFALSSDKTDLFAVALSAVLRRIEDTLNRVAIPRLLRYNGFPTECAPKFSFGDIETRDVVAYAQAVAALLGSNAITPDHAVENALRSLLNLPKAEPLMGNATLDAAGKRSEGDDAAPEGVGVDPSTETAVRAAVPMTQMELGLERAAAADAGAA